jgi:hypothetical protein
MEIVRDVAQMIERAELKQGVVMPKFGLTFCCSHSIVKAASFPNPSIETVVVGFESSTPSNSRGVLLLALMASTWPKVANHRSNVTFGLHIENDTARPAWTFVFDLDGEAKLREFLDLKVQIRLLLGVLDAYLSIGEWGIVMLLTPGANYFEAMESTGFHQNWIWHNSTCERAAKSTGDVETEIRR